MWRMPLNWADMAIVGRVARAHGKRGDVIVNSESDFAEARFRPEAVVYVLRDGAVVPLELTAARFHRGRPIVGIRGISTMEAAQGLAGTELRIPRERLQPLPPGRFYRHDLVGCVVRTRLGAEVGTVAAVEGGAEGSRLVVSGASGEVLIPLAAGICVDVDPGGRTIVVDPPDGLLELNDRTSRHRRAGDA